MQGLLPKCECMANGLKFTDMSKLPDCNNADEADEDENELESDESYKNH